MCCISAAIAGCVIVARRVGGVTIAACIAVTLTVTTMALAPRFFLEPWNVWVPVFAFALFLVLIWGVVCEHLALLPLAVAVGSHCVQTHISYTVLVTGLLGSTLVWLVWLVWRTDRLAGRHLLRWLLISTAVFLVAWLPPVIEQLRPGTGNMRKLYHQFTNPGEPFVGTRAAVKAMVGRFNLFGPWIVDSRKDPLSAPNYVGFVLFVALVGLSARWAWKRRQRVEVALYAVLAMATALGFVSTTRIFGTFYDYVIRWMSPLVALWIAACIWSGVLTWRARPAANPTDTYRLVGAVSVCALTAIAIGVVRGSAAEIPYERDSAITGALAGQLERSLDPNEQYQINELDPVALGAPAFGLALELERKGLHAGVGPWGESGVMSFRVVDDQHADTTLWYAASKPVIAAMSALPGAVVRASFDVRSEAEVARSDQMEAELLDQLCATGRAELPALLYSRWGLTALALLPDLAPETASLLQRFTELRQPAAVIELPVGVNGYDISPQSPHPCPA